MTSPLLKKSGSKLPVRVLQTCAKLGVCGHVANSQHQSMGTSQTWGRVYSVQWSGFLGHCAKQRTKLVESNRERRWVASINQGPPEVEALPHHTCTSTESGGNWEAVQFSRDQRRTVEKVGEKSCVKEEEEKIEISTPLFLNVFLTV